MQIWCKNLDRSVPALFSELDYDLKLLPQDIGIVENHVANFPFIHRSDIPDRVTANHMCWVATFGGETIYAIWLGVGYAYSYILGRKYELGDDEVYFYGGYTLPEYRKLGVHTSVISEILQEVGGNYKHIIGFIEPHNNAAIRSVKKISCKYYGCAGYIEIFGIRYYYLHDKGAFSKQIQKYNICKV